MMLDETAGFRARPYREAMAFAPPCSVQDAARAALAGRNGCSHGPWPPAKRLGRLWQRGRARSIRGMAQSPSPRARGARAGIRAQAGRPPASGRCPGLVGGPLQFQRSGQQQFAGAARRAAGDVLAVHAQAVLLYGFGRCLRHSAGATVSGLARPHLSGVLRSEAPHACAASNCPVAVTSR